MPSMRHRLDDVFHWFAEEINEEQIQQEHRGDHGAKQHEVVLAMNTADQIALITLDDERLDEAGVRSVADRSRYDPVHAVVAIDLR